MKTNIEILLDIKREKFDKEIETIEYKKSNGEIPNFIKEYLNDVTLLYKLTSRHSIFLVGFIEFLIKNNKEKIEQKDIKELSIYLNMNIEQCRNRLYELVKEHFIVKKINKEFINYKLNKFLFNNVKLNNIDELTLEITYSKDTKLLRVII